MKLILSAFLLGACFTNCFAQNIPYPIASKSPVKDDFYKTYHVTDDYRWMENLDDPELKKWVSAENAITSRFLANASNRNSAFVRIDELANVTYHNPVKKGKYYFSYAYQDNVSSPVLLIQNTLLGEREVIVDPNYIEGKGKISIRDYEVSHDSKYLAYEYSRNGSDWTEIKITKTTRDELKDHLTHVRYSGIAWLKDGFFYSSYPPGNFTDKAEGQVIMYHKVGTPQSDDAEVFKRLDPTIQFNFLTTTDERYFVLSEHNAKTNNTNYFYIDYQDSEPAIKPLLMNLKFGIDIIDSYNGKLIAESYHEADNGSIVEIDPQNPLQWRSIAPSYNEALLLSTTLVNDKIFAVYQSKMHPGIVVMDYQGAILKSIPFPLGTSINGLHGGPNDEELLYSYQSYTTPPVVYTINTTTYERKLTKSSTVSYDYENFVYQEKEYAVNDSVKVPLMLVYKKGLKLNGANPTLLEAYGGFGIISKPHFDPGIVYFLNKGGVYAFACIRGGGELGAAWAKAGKGANKQNSFNDLIVGAEYLIKEGYTSASKLAISGGSNGGLVVAAAAIKRPDLFKAVIPIVAPLDMIRFENFTVGPFHINEYGTVHDSTSFVRLYQYSPYQNIKPNVNYPAMLIITSDNDDRVPPLHSYKFTASLQSRPAQTNPILLLVNKQAGHYGVGDNSLWDELKSTANLYAFIVEILK